MRAPRPTSGLRATLAALCSLASLTAAVTAESETAVGAPMANASSSAPSPASACNEQSPLPFLVRGNYVLHKATSAADKELRRAMHKRAIRFRTERYGYVEGFGDPAWNRHIPGDYAQKTRFMGLRVGVNKRIAPALACVETEIHDVCKEAYQPVSLSGLRDNNTFYNGEVSNHRYGIAVDVDPQKNFCCGCVGPASQHPACKREGPVTERMQMPQCWVRSFEKFGFYWLGHDELEDTMHFEFLGDPSKIVKR